MENNKHGIPIPRHLLFIMRMTFFLFIVCVFQAYATDSYAQKTQLSIHENKIELGELLNKIEKQSDFYFFYSNNKINKKQKVTVDVENKTIFEILDIVLADSDITYEVNDKAIILITESAVKKIEQNKKQISGIITDTQKEPIIGANVIEKGTTNGTITDFDGKFSLDVSENTTLQITYIGYLSQEIKVSGQSSVNIILQEDTKSLEELIVVGYGTQKRSNVTTAVASVSEDDLKNRPVLNFGEALAGQMPGVQVQQVDGAPGGEGLSIRVRGTGSITQSNDPLYIVDGYPMEGNAFRLLNASDIESIQVLKDASSTAIYGSRGANGVVIVSTKRGKAGPPTVSINTFFGFP